MLRSSGRRLPVSALTASLRDLVPTLLWRPVAERVADGRLRFRELELDSGCGAAELSHCGCAAERLDDPEAYCEYCLPRGLIFEVRMRIGMAEFIGDVHFSLVGLHDDDGMRTATYEYWA